MQISPGGNHPSNPTFDSLPYSYLKVRWYFFFHKNDRKGWFYN